MSKDESAMVPTSCAGSDLLGAAVILSSARRLALRALAGCPSGQWKRTVNPSAYAYAGSNPAPATNGNGRSATPPGALTGRSSSPVAAGPAAEGLRDVHRRSSDLLLRTD